MKGVTEPSAAQKAPARVEVKDLTIDIDGRNVGNRYPVEVSLVGDAAGTLADLLPRLRRGEPDAWSRDVEGAVDDWRRLTRERAHTPADPARTSSAMPPCAWTRAFTRS